MANGIRRWRRRVVLGSAVAFGLFLAFSAWLLATAWYRLEGYAPGAVPAQASMILTPTQYGEVISRHTRPYVYTIRAGSGGAVVVFGAEHIKDPAHPQTRTIAEAWRGLAPTVALVESRLGMMFPAFMDPVETFGEPGLVHRLALDSGVPTFTWEPPTGRLIAGALAQGFSKERVALRWVLGPYFSNLRHGKPANPGAFVLDTLSERSAVEGIRGVLASIADVDAAWRREFPDGPDWRDVSDQFGLPGFLAEIDLNRPRDEHLVACLAELIGRGERVFVVCGSSHAVKIEPALRALYP